MNSLNNGNSSEFLRNYMLDLRKLFKSNPNYVNTEFETHKDYLDHNGVLTTNGWFLKYQKRRIRPIPEQMQKLRKAIKIAYNPVDNNLVYLGRKGTRLVKKCKK